LNFEIKKSLEVLSNGRVILYPTDTVWGIGCDACNRGAIECIYTIKQRKEAKSMLVLVDGEDMLSDYMEEVPGIALRIMDEATRPLTIIYPKARNLPDNLVADDGSIGIRIVNDPFCRQLIRAFGKPIVSTSANISGEPTPSTFEAISSNIKAAVDHIVVWRQDDRKPATASSIIQITKDGNYIKIR